MEEIKEVELRSRRGKFIYNKTYDPADLNIMHPSMLSRRGGGGGGQGMGWGFDCLCCPWGRAFN